MEILSQIDRLSGVFNPWAFSDGAFWPLSLFCWRLLITEPFLVAPFMYGAYFGGAFGHPHRYGVLEVPEPWMKTLFSVALYDF